MVQFTHGQVDTTSTINKCDDNVDPYELLHERIPELRSLTKSTFPSFMSLIAVGMRSLEVKREGGYLNDPYAAALAGDTAKAFMKLFPAVGVHKESMAYTILRHRIMDDEIEDLSSDIHQVVFVGSGMDTRSYRMQRFASCHVFELDSCEELAEKKKQVLKEMDAKLVAKQHDVIITDFSQHTWPEQLVAHGFDTTKPTLWIAEALLFYLDQDSLNSTLATIDSLSAPGSQMLSDMVGTGYFNIGVIVVNGELTLQAGTTDYEYEGGVLNGLPWNKEYLVYRSPDGVHTGRRWNPVKYEHYNVPKQPTSIGPWFVASSVKPHPAP